MDKEKTQGMAPRWETHINRVITKTRVRKAEACLIDNGIEKDEADTVLQAIGYILLGEELYETGGKHV